MCLYEMVKVGAEIDSQQEQMDESSKRSSPSVALRSPSQWPLGLGFKDRSLEDAYLDDLAAESKPRIVLGYVGCLLLMAFGKLAIDIVGYLSTTPLLYQGEVPVAIHYFLCSGLAIGIFLLALAASLFVYAKAPALLPKRAVLYIAQAAFFAYAVVVALDMWNNLYTWARIWENNPLSWTIVGGQPVPPHLPPASSFPPMH